MNIGYPIDEIREIQNFLRWIDLGNEISKIKWVNLFFKKKKGLHDLNVCTVHIRLEKKGRKDVCALKEDF